MERVLHAPAASGRRTGTSPSQPCPRRRHSHIKISLLQRIVINLFTLCDLVNALSGRPFHRDRPYAYASYLARSEAKSFPARLLVIWNAKRDKTQKLIYAKKRYGRIPVRLSGVCRKTPCGRLRLWAALLHG